MLQKKFNFCLIFVLSLLYYVVGDSLYKEGDDVLELDINTFNNTVYNKVVIRIISNKNFFYRTRLILLNFIRVGVAIV